MNDNIDHILLMVLQGKASDHEKERLNHWLIQSRENRKIFEGLRSYWNSTSDDKNKAAEIRESIWKNRSTHYSKKRRWSISKIVAVVSVISIAAFTYFYRDIRSAENLVEKTETIQWLDKSTEAGVKLETKLPDGSFIKLNSESHIRYPSSFDSVRIAYISGEVYFDIQHNADIPFIVYCKDVKTTVLGTSFIISDYDNESVQIALESGSVKTELINHQDQSVNYLTPGKYIKYSTNGTKIGVYDQTAVFGWKEGIFLFDQDDFNKAIKKLERWFGVTFIYEGKKPVWDLNGEYKNASLEGVLEAISYTENFEYKFIDEKTVKLKFKNNG